MSACVPVCMDIFTEGCGKSVDRGILKGRHMRSCTVRLLTSVAGKTKGPGGVTHCRACKWTYAIPICKHVRITEDILESNSCNAITEK